MGWRLTALRDGGRQVSPEPQPYTGAPGAETKLRPPQMLVVWNWGTRRHLWM